LVVSDIFLLLKVHPYFTNTIYKYLIFKNFDYIGLTHILSTKMY